MEESLAMNITMLRKQFSNYCEGRLSEFGLTDGIFYYLIYLGKHPGASPGEVAKALRADNGHTTRCVGKLEKLGYVVRQPNPEDRRGHTLSLTQRGAEIFMKVKGLFEEWDQIVCQRLEDTQREELLRLLRLLLPSKQEESSCMKHF